MPRYGTNQGIARNASQSEYPNLWRDLVGLYEPGVTNVGNLVNLAAKSKNAAATLVNTPTFTPSPSGSALTFNGSTQYATLGENFLFTTGGTVCAWVNSSIIETGVVQLVYARTSAGPRRDFFLYVLSGTAQLQRSNGGTFQTISTAALLTNSKWHHLAATFDVATLTGQIYVDGKLAATGLLTSTVTPSSSRLSMIGASFENPPNQYYFNGKMRDVRIYFRVLSAGEAMQSYMGASPLIRKQEIPQRQKYSGVFRYRQASRARQLMVA